MFFFTFLTTLFSLFSSVFKPLPLFILCVESPNPAFSSDKVTDSIFQPLYGILFS